MTRIQQADAMRRRAWELVKARGKGDEGLLEYTNVGLTIQWSFFSYTNRLIVRTKTAQVLVAEWGSDGKPDILKYTPGLWETRLKHLTRGAL